MDIHQLKVFAAVFKNRSFSKAGKALHLTQPTISDHIKSLEQEIGCMLFERLGKRIVPTGDAESLYDQAMELIDKMEALKESCCGIGKKSSSIETLIIGASTIPATYLLPRMITEFRKSQGRVGFEVQTLDSAQVIQKVLSFDLRLGLVGTSTGNKDLVFKPVYDDELVLVAPPGMVPSGVLTVEKIGRLPFVMREKGSGTQSEVDRILAAQGVHPRDLTIAAVFGSTEAVKAAVCAGLGVSILSRIAVADELKRGLLRELIIPWESMKRHIYLVMRARRELPRVYQAFASDLALRRG